MASRARFLLSAVGGAALAFLSQGRLGMAASTDHISASRYLFVQEFLANIRGVTIRYDQWAKQQPAEFGRWQAYASAIEAGQNPVPPTVTTRWGKALVAAGKITLLDATAPPPPPPPVYAYPGPTLFPTEIR